MFKRYKLINFIDIHIWKIQKGRSVLTREDERLTLTFCQFLLTFESQSQDLKSRCFGMLKHPEHSKIIQSKKVQMVGGLFCESKLCIWESPTSFGFKVSNIIISPVWIWLWWRREVKKTFNYSICWIYHWKLDLCQGSFVSLTPCDLKNKYR